MLKNTAFAIILFTFSITSIATSEPPPSQDYAKYIAKKIEVTELDWNLTQINIRMSPSAVFVEFKPETGMFVARKFLNSHVVKTVSTASLREELISTATLLDSCLSLYFPTYTQRGERDLVLFYSLGERNAREIGSYTAKSFRFHQNYFDFLKEIGR